MTLAVFNIFINFFNILYLFILVTAKALYDYEPLDVDEVGLQTGDVVTNIKQDKSGWWEGQVRGKRGMFPASYVMVIDNVSLQGIILFILLSP